MVEILIQMEGLVVLVSMVKSIIHWEMQFRWKMRDVNMFNCISLRKMKLKKNDWQTNTTLNVEEIFWMD